MDIAERDVFPHGEGILPEILKHDAEQVIVGAQVIRPDVFAVQVDDAAGRIIQAHQEFQKRRFAGAVQPDENGCLTGVQREVDVAQHLMCGARIGEADMLKPQGMPAALHNLRRRQSAGDCFQRNRLRHKGDYVVDEERSFINARRRGDQRGDSRGDGVQCAGVECVVADGQRAAVDLIGNGKKEQAVDGGGQRGQTGIPRPFTENQPAKTGEVPIEDGLELLHQRVAEVKHPDFLDHVLVDHQPREIVHLAAILGTAPHIQNVFAPVDEVDDGAWQRKQDDDHGGPRADGRQHRDETDHRDDAADETERRF